MSELFWEGTRWCRMCKSETLQQLGVVQDHDRVCTVCSRRQSDGALVTLQLTELETLRQSVERVIALCAAAEDTDPLHGDRSVPLSLLRAALRGAP